MQTILKEKDLKWSKKFKLPKAEWIKGKSKFLQVRMLEEIVAAKKQVKEKINKEMVIVRNKGPLNWFKKILEYVRRSIFTKIKEKRGTTGH